MRARFSPFAIWARAAFFGFAAVFVSVSKPILSARQFPENWGSPEKVWPIEPFPVRGYTYSTPEGAYFRTPDFLLRSTDGVNWELVPTPGPEDADPGETSWFSISGETQTTTVRLSAEEYLALPAQELEFGWYGKAVRFDGLWHTINSVSADGITWRRAEPQLVPPTPTFPDDRTAGRYGKTGSTVATDGETLVRLLSWWHLDRYDQTDREAVEEIRLTRDGETVERQYTVQDFWGILRRGVALSSTNLVTFEEGRSRLFDVPTEEQPVALQTFDYGPVVHAIIFHGSLLVMSDGGGTVAIRDLDGPVSPIPEQIPIPLAKAVSALAANSEAILASDRSGLLLRSTDGRVWTTAANLPSGGELSAGSAGFTYMRENRRWLSEDGAQWSEDTAPLPTTDAHFVSGTAGVLAAVDSDGNRLPDRIWKRQKRDAENDRWILLEENCDFESITYIESIDLVVLTSIATEAHPQPDGQSATKLHVIHSGNRRWTADVGEFSIGKAATIAYAEGFLVSAKTGVAVDDRLLLNQPEAVGSLTGLSVQAIGDRLLLRRSASYQDATDSLYLTGPLPSYPFSDGFLRPKGWRGSPWFGWVNTKDYPWVFQYPVGWIYVNGPDEDNCWLWDFVEGWFWTNQYYWPTIWSKDRGWRMHQRMKAEG